MSASEDEQVPVYATAEDVLEALQTRRPLNVVIPPASLRFGAQTKKPAVLYPEGWALVSRRGRPVQDSARWVFVLDEADGPSRLGLLPNATMEGMIRSSLGATSPLSFVVSGELTVFQGENYLLPRLAMRSEVRPEESIRADKTDRRDGPDAQLGEGEEASAEEVLELLMERSPAQKMIPSVVSAGADQSPHEADSPASLAGHALLPDGAPLVDRPGRIIDEGQWWVFVFESDHPDYPEPPMKLLPNQNVEFMVRASGRGEDGLVFLVSGEVTVYRDENYLLPRVVMRRVDSGNLKK
ncbi:MAG: hypothetical protein JSU63_11315 [Phycisphaerales bacterium]|nr:MAG: hypothetical protein JSU63_11315 [Phycisphaerales bacterium]